MDAVEMLKEKTRLTKECTINCDDCRLGARHTDYELNCVELSRMDPEQYVAIIEKWSKDCPRETYLSKLLEVFPRTKLTVEDNIPLFCPEEIGLNNIEKCQDCGGADELCVECWNQEWEEAQND